MKAICFFFVILFLTFHISIWGQSLNPVAIVKSMNEALELYRIRQYKAQMFFKEFGSDTFEVRNFLVTHRNNLENSNYGYDWKVSEKLKPQGNNVIAQIEVGYNGLFSGNSTIFHSMLVVKAYKTVITQDEHKDAIELPD